MRRRRHSPSRLAGFTLIELLLSISILVVITSMVYASFTTVAGSVSKSRDAMTEVRLRAFLTRSLTVNLETVYADPGYGLQAFQFLGESDESLEGPKDRLRFCSTAPLAGGAAMPGDLKEVLLEVIDPDDEGSVFRELEDGEDYDTRTLRVTETPMLAANVQSLSPESGVFEPAEGFETPHWSVPVRSMDLEYFDGTSWLEDWDSMELGRVPWAVRIAINFARTEKELESEEERGFDPIETPEYTLTIALPRGLRLNEPQFEGEGAAPAEGAPEEGGNGGGREAA